RLNVLVKEQETFRQERERLGGELAKARAGGEQVAARLRAEARHVEGLHSQLQAVQRALEEAAAGREEAQQALAEQRQCWDADRAALQREWEAILRERQQQVAGLEADIERLAQERGERRRQHAAVLERAEGLARDRDRLAGRAEQLQREAAEAE